jgi:hypothetical protein
VEPDGRRAGRRAHLAVGPAQPGLDYTWLSGDLAAAGFVAATSTAGDHRGVAVTIRPA